MGGNNEGERAALVQLAFDPDLAAVHLHQFTAEIEAQANALTGGGIALLHLVEPVKNPLAPVSFDARPGITDGDLEEARVERAFRHFDQDRSACGGELEGVGEEVAEDLFQALLGVLDTIARRHGVTIAAVASRAILDRPNVGAVIIGARTARHLEQTLPIFDIRLGDEDRTALETILGEARGPSGPIFALEADKTGRHGRIMKYNLNTETG